MSWLFLGLAGILEIGWAVSAKMTNGWTNLPYLGVNVAFGLAAAYSLSLSLRTLPLGIAYPVWKGIAILGILTWETAVDRQPMDFARVAFALLIVVGIVGLKLTAVTATR